MKDRIYDILKTERRLRDDKQFAEKCAAPENCYLLGKGEVLCYPRATGDSRYPYSFDGLTLWAYASGEMSLNESAFYYILPSDEGKEPYVAFFGGIEDDGGYVPLSITGVARQGREKDVTRFTYYTPHAVYYVAKTPEVAYVVRALVSQTKKAVFSLFALNRTNKPIKTYLSAFFNCLMMHQAGESVETKWFKQCKTTEHGFIFESVEDLDRTTHLKNYGVINRAVNIRGLEYAEHTASRSDYVGGRTNSLGFASPLFTGHFEQQKQVCRFSETAAAGDMYAFTLAPEAMARLDYIVEARFDEKAAEKAIAAVTAEDADNAAAAVAAIKDGGAALTMKFGKFDGVDINNNAFNEFVSNVERQVEFAALAKNSGVSMLGVRDVAQQLEAALMWTPDACRRKFIEMLSFLDPSGRPLRQYSVPANGASPQVDTREHIDQGNWIISALHTYLSFTDDYSLLDEVCGYCKIVGRNRVEYTDERNSVFEHLTRIADFLISNVDGNTGCLRALYGDWNDALDGLGVSNDPDKEYGTGVSVMASLHLYKNMKEMLDIVDAYGDKFCKRKTYVETEKALEAGLKKYAVVERDGARKILHGWGDERSYLVGSFDDVDGKSRNGLTSNAFWAVCGAYLWDKSIKRDILRAYDDLDSKYGLKTFEPYFAPDAKGVGRIINLPKGTAENGATYIHATIFGIWSLFCMGEGKRGWDQIAKVIPLTHKLITTTPFVMSNSYAQNKELGLDGESMNDWFTGSANAMIKTLVWCVFGVRPDLGGVRVSPSEYMPFDDASLTVTVKGKKITVDYHRSGSGRTISLNGKKLPTSPDPSSDAPLAYIKTEELSQENKIAITD